MKNQKLIIFIWMIAIIFLAGNYFVYAANMNIEVKESPIYQITTFDRIQQDYADFKKDGYTLEDLVIEGNVLVLTVQFTWGGCKEPEFKLMWDGLFMKSNPPQVALVLYLEKEDSCEANYIITKKLKFDLTPIGEDTVIRFYDYSDKRYTACYNVRDRIFGCPGIGGGCSNDTKTCLDGSVVGRNLNNNCEFDLCSDLQIKKCDNVGVREKGKYCSADGFWQEQKDADFSCENHFECASNLCLEDKCVSKSLLKKIFDWIKNFFGFG